MFIYENAPFPQCHASTIAEAGDALVAAWFGGEHENHPGVCIWVSRLEDWRTRAPDRPWSPPIKAAEGIMGDGTRFACWNPVLFQPRTGPLLLFYKVGPNPRAWWGMRTVSEDGGNAWQPPTRLPDGILGPIKNKPLELADGSLLCPSSTESATQEWRVHIERTGDSGRTWTRSGSIGFVDAGKAFEAIQPSLLTYADGRMQALCRSRQGVIVETWSPTEGQTWSALQPAPLPNPNSGTDAVTLADGRQLLVYNHSATSRSPLNVAVSDDGKTWQAACVLEDLPGEYSYPAVMQTSDGTVHITYTWNRVRIKYTALDPALLEARDMPNGNWP